MAASGHEVGRRIEQEERRRVALGADMARKVCRLWMNGNATGASAAKFLDARGRHHGASHSVSTFSPSASRQSPPARCSLRRTRGPRDTNTQLKQLDYKTSAANYCFGP